MAYLQDIVLNFDNKTGLHIAVYASAIPHLNSFDDCADIIAFTIVNCDNMMLALPTLLLRLTSLQYLYIRQSKALVSSPFVADCSDKVSNFFLASTSYRTRLELLLQPGIGCQCVSIMNTYAYPFCRNLEDVVLAVRDMDPSQIQQVLTWCDLTLKTLLLFPTAYIDLHRCATLQVLVLFIESAHAKDCMATLNSLPPDAVCNIIIHVDGHPKLDGQCGRFDNSLRVRTQLTWICPRKRDSLWNLLVRHIISSFPVLSAAGRVKVEARSGDTGDL